MITKEELLALDRLTTEEQLETADSLLDPYLTKGFENLTKQEEDELDKISDLIEEYENRTETWADENE